MLISVYAPINAMRRMYDVQNKHFIVMLTLIIFFFKKRSLLLGTIFGYGIHALCGLKGIGPAIDYSGISSSPWFRAPAINYQLEFDSQSIGMVMPILVVFLAENLGHMKAIQSIITTGPPMLKYIGRAYLGDALGCLIASVGGTIPFTTYAENIGVLV